MKSRAIAILAFAFLVCAGFAAPAFAQSARTEAQYQHFLDTHPDIRADLRENPSLVSDPGYLSRHKGLAQWMNQHPYVRNQVRWGDYDSNHQWHDADWWHRNNPDWMYDHHPEWVRDNPAWRNDGDWDDQHRWHSRDWWFNNHREWVEQHHPNWAENQEHREYQEHHEYNEAHPYYGESEEHHGNGHAYGHYKDHDGNGNGKGNGKGNGHHNDND
jgi:hypothetical protein